MANAAPMTGGCACGTVRYACNAEPVMFLLCRCPSCRHATGSAYAANVWFPADAVTFTKGKPKEFVRTAESGRPAYHRFCADCGSPLGMRADAFSEITGIAVGSLDEPSELKPAANVWLGNKFAWDMPDSTLPGFDRNLET